MSGDVVYTDVKFAKKGGKKEPSSNQEDVTYSEVRKPTPKNKKVHPPQDEDVTYSMVTIGLGQTKAKENNLEKEEDTTYAEVQRDPQPNKSSGNSKVKKRVAIGILLFVLVLAIIGIAIALNIISHHRSRTTDLTSTVPATTEMETTTSTAPPCVLQCDKGWKLNGTTCYYLSSNKLSWTQSREACPSVSGTLVKIGSREEQMFVFSLLSENELFWIGLSDSETEGRWKWTDGSALDQSFWQRNSPDNIRDQNRPEGEDCAVILIPRDRSAVRSWGDVPCNQAHRFICEKEAICK